MDFINLKMTKDQGREGDENSGQNKSSCVDCKIDLSGAKSKCLKCDLCKSMYCYKNSKLKQALFNEIGKEESILWSCAHCRIAIPGVNLMMANLRKLEKTVGVIEKKK